LDLYSFMIYYIWVKYLLGALCNSVISIIARPLFREYMKTRVNGALHPKGTI